MDDNTVYASSKQDLKIDQFVRLFGRTALVMWIGENTMRAQAGDRVYGRIKRESGKWSTWYRVTE